jgi:hypothetical protein
VVGTSVRVQLHGERNARTSSCLAVSAGYFLEPWLFGDGAGWLSAPPEIVCTSNLLIVWAAPPPLLPLPLFFSSQSKNYLVPTRALLGTFFLVNLPEYFYLFISSVDNDLCCTRLISSIVNRSSSIAALSVAFAKSHLRTEYTWRSNRPHETRQTLEFLSTRLFFVPMDGYFG